MFSCTLSLFALPTRTVSSFYTPSLSLYLYLFSNDSRVVNCTLFFASSILFWAFLLVNCSYFHSPARGFSPVYSTSQLELNPEYRRKPRSNRTDLFSPVFDFSQLFRNQVQFFQISTSRVFTNRDLLLIHGHHTSRTNVSTKLEWDRQRIGPSKRSESIRVDYSRFESNVKTLSNLLIFTISSTPSRRLFDGVE